jgi:plastocyanin
MLRGRFRIAWILLSVLAVAAMTAGCGTSGTKLPVSEMTAHTDSDGVQKVDVEAHSFYFKPSRIVVDAGKPVDLTIHFKNWFAPHNFTCIDQDAGISAHASVGAFSFGKTRHVKFTPTKPGEYEFFCHVDGHAKKGMKGTIVVR